MVPFYKYCFDPKLPVKEVEESLLLAVLAVECLHGRSKVRLDASFSLDAKAHTCIVNASTEVGCAIARIFTGFLNNEFGELAFKVERINEGNSEVESPKVAEVSHE